MTVGFNYAEEGLTQLSNALVLIVAMITIAGELILWWACLLYTSPSPRDGLLSRMPSSA